MDGSLVPSTSIVNYTATTGTITIASTDYYDVQFIPGSGSPIYVLQGGAFSISVGSGAVKIDDASDFGTVAPGSRSVVKTSAGVLYAFVNDAGNCEIWRLHGWIIMEHTRQR